ncbi:MAG: hypothetical protein JWO06_2528 [Bacteroidota bacterium]|nr:hypothetical protein [Bacteroidota bacterium]
MKKTLLTTVFITGYFLLMSTLGIFASVPVSVHKTARETVRKEIIRNIACPEFLTTNSDANQVRVVVDVTEAGNVTVAEIASANPQLKQYVLSQLQDLKLKNSGSAEKVVLVIKFKVS